MYSSITQCRICGNTNLQTVLDLGMMSVTGIFPKNTQDSVPKGPLKLVRCSGEDNCGLIQLRDTFEAGILYGDNYGYSSALNPSMVRHLQDIVEHSMHFATLRKQDLIVDIGSNDGTLLSFFPENTYALLGIDPTAHKFMNSYRQDIKVVADFFSKQNVKKIFPKQKAKIVYSIAMFYDLDDPVGFAGDIEHILEDDGVWVLEQSYCNTMIKRCSYDTICHEHLEYYNLRQIKWILDILQMKIVDISFNDINGGSFQIVAAKKSHPSPEVTSNIEKILRQEKEFSYNTDVFEKFALKIRKHKRDILTLLTNVRQEGKTVYGYGASTKGNVLLQYVGITPEMMPNIMEINPDKYGKYTPGTHIPIISDEEAQKNPPDYFFVLPWHFREHILKKESFYRENGTKFIFPLPTLEII